MALSDKQRGVLGGAITGAVITVAVLVGAIALIPASSASDANVGARIAFALEVDVMLALFLALSVGRLARHRVFTPGDIDGGELTDGAQRANVTMPFSC